MIYYFNIVYVYLSDIKFNFFEIRNSCFTSGSLEIVNNDNIFNSLTQINSHTNNTICVCLKLKIKILLYEFIRQERNGSL